MPHENVIVKHKTLTSLSMYTQKRMTRDYFVTAAALEELLKEMECMCKV